MKTTKKHFEIFKKECQKWIDFFGLSEYGIEFFHGEVDECRGSTTDYEHDMRIDLHLSAKLLNPSREMIAKTAFHEVCEALLMRLRRLGDIYCSHEIVNKEVHAVIHKLENSVFKSIKK